MFFHSVNNQPPLLFAKYQMNQEEHRRLSRVCQRFTAPLVNRPPDTLLLSCFCLSLETNEPIPATSFLLFLIPCRVVAVLVNVKLITSWNKWRKADFPCQQHISIWIWSLLFNVVVYRLLKIFIFAIHLTFHHPLVSPLLTHSQS